MEEILKDERFSHVFKDPRFKKLPTKVEKIAVDKRFKQMFKDRKFKEKYVMDKRGRPLNMTSSEDLKKLYNMSSESSESEDDDDQDNFTEKIEDSFQNLDSAKSVKEDINKRKHKKVKEADSKTNLESSISENVTIKEKKFVPTELSDKEDLESEEDSEESDSSKETESSDDSDSEKENSEESSDSESEDSESEESTDEEFDHHWEELRKDAPEALEITRRLAVCNMDWDRIRVEDLFAAFDSFRPAAGCINSVKIYPSEFGRKRMEEEKLRGPPELVEITLGSEDEDEAETTKKGGKYHREKLRQYQINRLKYFYAVVDCDSPETANSLYEQLNGMEYESSSIVFDLRFIPDDLVFDEKPHSESLKVPDLTEYKPKHFVNTALQQVKVSLTWDETDPKRRDVLKKAFTAPNDIERDIKDYLASSSSENEEEIIESTQHEEGDLTRKQRMAKYRALLQSLEDKEKDEENEYEMEITWEPGLKEKTEKIVKEKMEKDTLTPFEETLKKKKDHRAKKKGTKFANEESESEKSYSEESCDDDDDHFASRKTKKSQFFMKEEQTPESKSKLAELALLVSDSTKEVIDVKKTKSKRKNKISKPVETDDNEIPDVNDPRFSAMYTSHLFSIDPSDSHFKSRKGMPALMEVQQRKRKNRDPLISQSETNGKKYRTST